MKKIILLLMCMFSFAFVSYAQTVTESKWYDNYFIGINAGGTYSFEGTNTPFWQGLNGVANVSVGRYLTPVTGIQANYELGFAEFGKTTVDHHNLSVDGLLNFNNLFMGYAGKPRTFEVVGLLGLGWFHTYGIEENDNNASLRVGSQFNFNLGKKRAWVLNIVPVWTYLPNKNIQHSYMALTAGFTYKFKNSNKTHNFTIAKLYDQNEVDLLNEKVNSLREQNKVLSETNKGLETQVNNMSENINELTKCCAEAKQLKTTMDKKGISNVVGFNIGQSEVTKQQMANLQMVANEMKDAKDAEIVVVGYADKGTGTPEVNQKISERRAEAVKKALVKLGVDESKIKTKAVGDTEQPFSENDMNRAVLFIR